MALRKVSKLHGVLGLPVVAAVLAIGCSNNGSEGCEPSRTCSPESGGNSGVGGEAGGRSGSESSGAAGTDDGGMGGDAGAGGNGVLLVVETFTPADGSSDVDRDIEIVATLSELIDEATVTETSVTLTGPDGEVPGTVSVDENMISFVPAEPLGLLRTYTFTLRDAVADLAGSTLINAASATFRVRDGRWSEPTFPFGDSVPRVVTQFHANAIGDVVVGMETWPTNESLYAAVYAAGTGLWTSGELPAPTGGVFSLNGVAIGGMGHAVASWTTSDMSFGWSRSLDGKNWHNGRPLGGAARLALTSRDQAVAVWSEGEDPAGVQTMNVIDGSVQPESRPPLEDWGDGPHPVASLDRVGIVEVGYGRDDTRVVYLSWKEGSTWSSPDSLDWDFDNIRSISVDSDEQGNIAVIWTTDNDAQSLIYSREWDYWRSGRITIPVTSEVRVDSVDVAAGNVIVTLRTGPEPATWAAVYLPGVGWVADSIVRVDDTFTGNHVGVSIDRTGHGLAIWHEELRSRRYVPNEGWQQPSPALGTNIDPDRHWAAAAPDGSVLIVSTEVSGDTNRTPWAIRFE